MVQAEAVDDLPGHWDTSLGQQADPEAEAFLGMLADSLFWAARWESAAR